MGNMQRNFMEKVAAANHTARDLTKAGLSFIVREEFASLEKP